MGDEPQVTAPDEQGRHRLVLDELAERLALLRELTDSDEATDRVLAELGGSGRVEREMIRELAAYRPISHPDRLQDAHFVAMRALEVLARNGARPPSQLKVGRLTPVASFLVQQVIRFLVRQHQSRVADAVHDLYSRRIAWTPDGDPSRRVLMRARRDLERASPSLKKSTGGLPTFLVGGAAVSSFTQLVRGGAGSALGTRIGLGVTVAVAFALLGVISWVILRGAAVARRRIRISLDRPLAALWETVGSCGNPPRDAARNFALMAIVITAVGWLLVPVGVVLVLALF